MTDDIKRQLWAEGERRKAEAAIQQGDIATARRILREIISAGFAFPVYEVKDTTATPRKRR